MLNALSEELNWTNTENGALAYHDTGDACLNLFSTAGALREASAKRLKDMFLAAYAENPVYAMRILFYQRDTRGGLGERSVFRQLLQYAATIYVQPYYRVQPDNPTTGYRGLRTSRYTFAVHATNGKIDRTVLFDRDKDPYEMKNIATERPKLVRALHKQLREWLMQTNDPFAAYLPKKQ